MRDNVVLDDVSVVLLGSFNPRIFHPSWLAGQGLISEEQAENSDINVVAQEIAQFSAGYMNFDIQANRFFVRTVEIYKEVVQDLVLSLFREHLPHSPVWAVGLNRSFEFRCKDQGSRTKFGSLLVPTAPWGAWGAEIEKSFGDKRHGGMTRVVMLQDPRPDGLPGHVQADLRPNMADPTGAGVFLDVNNHFNVGQPDSMQGSVEAMDIVKERWSMSVEHAGALLDQLVETADAV